MNFTQINERLKDILATQGKKTKDKDIALELGIDPNVYAGMKFRNSPPYKEIMDFLSRNHISINLFFYHQNMDELRDENYKSLKMFDVNASLGGGANNDDENYEDVFIDKRILEKSGLEYIGKLDLITAVGESMEPYIMDMDICFIAVGAEYKDGKIYAINTPDGLVIKECHKQRDELMLISYNPIYLPIRYSIYECKIIGEFVGIIRGSGRLKIDLKLC